MSPGRVRDELSDRTSEPKLPGPMCRAGHLRAALMEADRLAACAVHRLPVRSGPGHGVGPPAS
jgi:hypothetical protein